jgi:hypothetical protein
MNAKTTKPCCALIAIAVSLLLLAGGGRAAPVAENSQSSPKGLRVFTCAHSFHGFVYKMLAETAKGAGITDHVSAGYSGIGGSRVIQHWDVADEKNQAKAALNAGKIDVLTLSPIWLPDEGIEKFATLGLQHNPDIKVTVQEFWLPNDTYEPKYPLDTKKAVDHNATNLAELKEKQQHYDRDVDEYCQAINKRLGKDVIVTVPVGMAVVALREKVAAGEAPGLTKQWDLFRDNWGHPQAPMRVLSTYCHFAVIYHRSPVGLPMPSDLKDPKKPEWDEKLNRLLQELAWDAVIHHPMSGVTVESK